MSAATHQLPYQTPEDSPPWHNQSVHLIALLTAAATFPLIFMGGLVTSHQAGLAVPDWPNSYGYNMFLFPPRYWVGGVLYEHTHRLMATVVGFLSTLLTVAAWPYERRPWVRWLATSVLIGVIFQGILGGLRVVFKNLDLAIVHACVAQAFFCLAASAALVTSNWWRSAPDLSATPDRPLFRAAFITVIIIYLQLIVGATMRHEQAGLAIPDFPLTFGHILPPAPSAVDSAFRTAALHNWPDPALSLLAHVTAWQIYLQFAHRIGALIVTIAIGVLSFLVLKSPARAHLIPLTAMLLSLLLAQITLGILTVLLRKPADIASLHVAVGALTLLTTFIITVRTARLFRIASPISPSPILPFSNSPTSPFASSQPHPPTPAF